MAINDPVQETIAGLDDEVLLKAVKLLEALQEPCNEVSPGADHSWRMCRRCMAIRQFDFAPDVTRILVGKVLDALALLRQRQALDGEAIGAVRFVVDRFQEAEAAGYRSRERQFAISILLPVLQRLGQEPPASQVQETIAELLSEARAEFCGLAGRINNARPESIGAIDTNRSVRFWTQDADAYMRLAERADNALALLRQRLGQPSDDALLAVRAKVQKMHDERKASMHRASNTSDFDSWQRQTWALMDVLVVLDAAIHQRRLGQEQTIERPQRSPSCPWCGDEVSDSPDEDLPEGKCDTLCGGCNKPVCVETRIVPIRRAAKIEDGHDHAKPSPDVPAPPPTPQDGWCPECLSRFRCARPAGHEGPHRDIDRGASPAVAESEARLAIVDVLKRLELYDLPSCPELTLGTDGELELDWCAGSRCVLTMNVRSNGRVGWSALIEDESTYGHTFLPEWPAQLHAVLKSLKSALAVPPHPQEPK